MISFPIIGLIGGTLLGLRFKVLALLPTILFATSGVAVNGIVSGHGLKVIALTAFGTVALLQLGYVVGCVLKAMAPEHFLPHPTTHRPRRAMD